MSRVLKRVRKAFISKDGAFTESKVFLQAEVLRDEVPSHGDKASPSHGGYWESGYRFCVECGGRRPLHALNVLKYPKCDKYVCSNVGVCNTIKEEKP